MADIPRMGSSNLATLWAKLKSYFVKGNTGVFYGTCATAAATETKAVTCADFAAADLAPGTIITVKFDATNSAAVGNIKLDVNGTGAKPIKYIYNGSISNIPAVGYIKAGQTYQFYYDGTNWVVLMIYNTNTNPVYLQHQNNILIKTAVTAHSLIVGDSSGYSRVASGVTFDLSYPIVWCTAALAAGASNYANMFLSHYDLNIATGAKAGFTSTKNKVIYLVVKISGVTATVQSEIITDALPTSDDGKVYIVLGKLGNQSTGSNYFVLYPEHPMFWYKNGAVRVYGGNAENANTVNGHTVAADVPSGAKFTDTTYTAGTGLTLSGTQFKVHNVPVQEIVPSNSALSGTVDPLTAGMIGAHSSNKSFGLPANAITIEYSTDGGSTWVDYGASDNAKRNLFSELRATNFYLGKATVKENNTVNCQLRVTIEPLDRYVTFHGVYIWCSTQGNTWNVSLERSSIGAKDTFTTVFENHALNGWSGPNIRYFSNGTFGGNPNQTGNAYKYRLTFKQTAINANYAAAVVQDIRFLGYNVYTSPNNMVMLNHLYKWDVNLNATFPGEVTATDFNGTVNGHTISGSVAKDVPSNAKFTDTTYTAQTTSIGSASAGTAIPADDITAWTTNTPTAVTKKTVVTSASGATASYANGVLTLTNGSFGTGDSVAVTPGTAASLSYTAKSIPNISVSNKTVATGITAS